MHTQKGPAVGAQPGKKLCIGLEGVALGLERDLRLWNTSWTLSSNRAAQLLWLCACFAGIQSKMFALRITYN